jgi:FAD:protein FMN transferase
VRAEAIPKQDLSRLVALGFERDPDPVAVDAVLVEPRTYRVAAARPAMGTLVTVTVLARSRDRGETAIGRAYEEMDRLIGILSRFESDSALSHLNADGRLRGPPPDLLHVVSRALRFHRITGGAFDISVGPLLRLFGTRSDTAPSSSPSDAELREALARVGARWIEAGRRQIRFDRDGMRVTVDGIAKGYIADRMAVVLERHRVRRYLIDAGGDIRVSGRKEGRRPWTVGVRDPWDRGGCPDRVELRRGAVATSGSYERYLDSDRRFHHIVEAEAGRSPDGSVSVTVVAPTAMAADALATSLFIMAPTRALAFADALTGCECLIIDRSGRVLRSRGWRSAAPADPGEGDLP